MTKLDRIKQRVAVRAKEQGAIDLGHIRRAQARRNKRRPSTPRPSHPWRLVRMTVVDASGRRRDNGS